MTSGEVGSASGAGGSVAVDNDMAEPGLLPRPSGGSCGERISRIGGSIPPLAEGDVPGTVVPTVIGPLNGVKLDDSENPRRDASRRVGVRTKPLPFTPPAAAVVVEAAANEGESDVPKGINSGTSRTETEDSGVDSGAAPDGDPNKIAAAAPAELLCATDSNDVERLVANLARAVVVGDCVTSFDGEAAAR
jgi:hypothetical protein